MKCRMLIAFDAYEEPTIMMARGAPIESDLEQGLADELRENIFIDDGPNATRRGANPTRGIWVYEVTPKWDSEDGPYAGDGSNDYADGDFRPLTDVEWRLLQENKVDELFELWVDIKSLSEAEQEEDDVEEDLQREV